MSNIKSIENIVERLGVSEIAEAVDVTPEAVRMSRARGHFAATWYKAMQKLAKKKRVALPIELFAFRGD